MEDQGDKGVGTTALEDLLAKRNCWMQTIHLELITGQPRDVFDISPAPAKDKQLFNVDVGAALSVSLFEFELREMFVQATTKSGCRWWVHSKASKATKRFRNSLWNLQFFCRHHGVHWPTFIANEAKAGGNVNKCVVILAPWQT